MGFETGKIFEYCKFKKIGYKIVGIFLLWKLFEFEGLEDMFEGIVVVVDLDRGVGFFYLGFYGFLVLVVCF